ncbi:MAG TPA: VTT domain-containing protein [Gemmatimonadales bacterium]|nr:VTT domain-containing protein [Gemmatimonadales bacterium]HEX4627659.1 VTT domain-containing protein [Gemmatimonadales bacterium]
MRRLLRVLCERRGTAEWDAVLRGTGVVALLALYPTLRWPWVAGLTGFFCLTLFVSGPISVVVPAAFEPMLMVAGRAYPPLLVAAVAVAGNLYMDYINYHVFGAAIRHPRLEKAKNSRVVQSMLRLFQRSPFFAVWLCSWSPIPYWIVSTLAPLSRYSMRKYLFATFLGRGPRVWFFASLGLVIPVATQVLVAYIACAITVGVALLVWKRRVAVRRARAAATASPASSTLVPASS